jgi:hypothetical protein
MRKMNKVLAMGILAAVAVVSVIDLGLGVGIQHVFALGDCNGCTINLGGDHEHHDHSDCGSESDCSGEEGTGGGENN